MRKKDKNNIGKMKTVHTLVLSIAIATVLGTSILITNLQSMTKDYRTLVSENFQNIEYVDEISVDVSKHQSLLFKHIGITDEKEKRQVRNVANMYQKDIEDLLAEYESLTRNTEYESYYHTLYSNLIGYFDDVSVFFELSESANNSTAGYYFENTLSDYIDTVNKSTDNIIDKVNENTKSDRKRIETKMLELRIYSLLILLSILLITIVFSTRIIKASYEIASKDSLTKIDNMNQFTDICNKLKSKNNLSKYTLFNIDIVDFKYINQKYGSSTGDEILSLFAAKLNSYTDKNEYIARQSGDIFLALIKDVHANDFAQFFEHNVFKVNNSEDNSKTKVSIEVKCGIYNINTADSIEDIFNYVSIALNEAKCHKSEYQVTFRPEMLTNLMSEKNMVSVLDTALANGEFKVFYQPKVNTQNNKICGCEALIRWERNGQLISPGKFIPIFEKEGKITKIDFFVFETVCQDLQDWKSRGIDIVRVSSNFSKLHLLNDHIAEDIIAIANKYDVDKKYLEVELTESSGYKDMMALEKLINRMKTVGITTTIDDFGTGFSALSLLKDLNFDVVKLDKSFLNGVLAENSTNRCLLKQIVGMIYALDKEVICEGVEVKEEADFLKSIDCMDIQGFYFDKPLHHDEFEKRLIQQYYNDK